MGRLKREVFSPEREVFRPKREEMNPPIFKKGKKKMRNRNNHDLTFKKKLSKCDKVFRAFSELQVRYGDLLDRNDDISEVKANVLLKEFELGENFTSDFVCTKKNGELMVRECVYKKNLLKPSTVKGLDESRRYWLNRGVKDWGIVLDE